ncbi:hypothetical protein E2C01_074919 [Portunus trituberculatus]|uniref:Uncharacterized protein n=1 Tax=Portunus trituberculatus TaxID=210409 RepID=A0A5B7I4Q3_PORTR|nr:hypothetical protein [Portunus trituberculatus]
MPQSTPETPLLHHAPQISQVFPHPSPVFCPPHAGPRPGPPLADGRALARGGVARVSLRQRQGPEKERPMSWEGELSDADVTNNAKQEPVVSTCVFVCVFVARIQKRFALSSRLIFKATKTTSRFFKTVSPYNNPKILPVHHRNHKNVPLKT